MPAHGRISGAPPRRVAARRADARGHLRPRIHRQDRRARDQARPQGSARLVRPRQAARGRGRRGEARRAESAWADQGAAPVQTPPRPAAGRRGLWTEEPAEPAEGEPSEGSDAADSGISVAPAQTPPRQGRVGDDGGLRQCVGGAVVQRGEHQGGGEGRQAEADRPQRQLGESSPTRPPRRSAGSFALYRDGGGASTR